MSDILFDPLADPVIIKQLIARPAAQWQAIFASSTQTGYTHSPNDTNYPFAESALSLDSAQNPFDFVIALGDYLRHDFQSAFVSAGGSPSQSPGLLPRQQSLSLIYRLPLQFPYTSLWETATQLVGTTAWLPATLFWPRFGRVKRTAPRLELFSVVSRPPWASMIGSQMLSSIRMSCFLVVK